MAVKLTKNELKAQKDHLKQFERYLPTLQLKKQQLQSVVMQVTAQLEYAPADDPRQAIFFAFADARLPLIELKTTTASLEQVFLALTQEDAPQTEESTLDDAASDPDAEPVQATQEEEEDS